MYGYLSTISTQPYNIISQLTRRASIEIYALACTNTQAAINYALSHYGLYSYRPSSAFRSLYTRKVVYYKHIYIVDIKMNIPACATISSL